MVLTISGNFILDLAFIQVISILYLSDAVLPLVKWKESDNMLIAAMKVPPPAAWYEKAAGSKLKLMPDAAKPCMRTTGFSIQTMSRLADILPKYGVKFCQANDFFHRKLETIAALQLQFCMEYLEENPFSSTYSSAVLEGGVWFLKTKSLLDGLEDFHPDLDNIYQKFADNLDTNQSGTLDLAAAIRGISVWYKHNRHKSDDLLSSLVLEVLNRKSQSGLFHYGPFSPSSVPMGQQFFILDALLQAYSHVKLDYVLEEVFGIFSSLYNIAYKDTIQMFAFKQRSISYTAFEIAALLSCLNKIAIYSSDNSRQKAMIDQIIDTFLEFLTQSYMEFHETEVRKLLKWISLSHECKIKTDTKPVIRTLFPKRIRLSCPGPEISWNRKGITNQADIFFLCSTLLDFLDEESVHSYDLTDSSFKLVNTLGILFDLLA
ncbi:MAG: hypothetical protein PHP79_05725 [Clostridia bacterium]|nr:hypothetical protein [Clostridia bacterium]